MYSNSSRPEPQREKEILKVYERITETKKKLRPVVWEREVTLEEYKARQ